MTKKTIRDIDVFNKRILVRVDFNVPIDQQTGSILDTSRIKAAIPTLQYLLDRKARLVLCSHFGRPKGKVKDNLRMGHIAKRLAELMKRPVLVATDVCGDDSVSKCDSLKAGDVLFLENLRFEPGEENNDANFSASLASLAEIFVNDAFGVAHRSHASTVGVTGFLPSVAGLLMEKELQYLRMATDTPDRPLVVILGGAKISDKMAVVDKLMEKLDVLIVGGGMAATFFKASSIEIGRSLYEEESLQFVSGIIKKSKLRNIPIVLPTDLVVTDSFESSATPKTCQYLEVKSHEHIMDVGNRTIDLFRSHLIDAKTVFWNGPMGVYEFPTFSNGTRQLARILQGLDATTIVGGGSTADVVLDMGISDKMNHVSTGGGASLEFLGGKILPGVDALLEAHN